MKRRWLKRRRDLYAELEEQVRRRRQAEAVARAYQQVARDREARR